MCLVRKQVSKCARNKKVLTCNILGPGRDNEGLGNQLFCVCATLSLAKDNDDKAVFPELNFYPFKFYGETIFHKLNKDKRDKSFVTALYREKPYTSTVFEKIPYTASLCLHGHFQSYKYFENNEKFIRETIDLPDSMKEKINKNYNWLYDKNTVSVHFRRGDYLKLKNHYFQLTEDYYTAALEKIDNYDTIVVFSDDIEWVRENSHFLKGEKVFIDSACDVTDLYLMSKMKNNIIANSTFSWWGAFLNQNKQKIIVAPQHWFGSDERKTKDLIPSDWIRI